jgi:superfamily II DNA or RNA helicase
MDWWPHQNAIKEQNRQLALSGAKKWVVVSQCGTGKTAMMMRDIKDAVRKGLKVAIYSCRIQNTHQLIDTFEKTNIRYGVMASAFRGRNDIHAPVQICQVQTCFRRKHIFAKADLVFIDEVHQQMNESAMWCWERHESAGARWIVGWTATPVGYKRNGFFETCTTPPKHQELLDCKAHLPCKVYAPDLPLSVIKGTLRVQSNGETSAKQDLEINNPNKLQSRIYNFMDRLNPDRLPTVGFGPDVASCRAYVNMGLKHGIRCASMDADRIAVAEKQPSGKYEIRHYDSNLANRSRVIAGSESGEFTVLWNRFILREAVDMPWLAHCIVATSMSGIATYLQSVGRVLRYFPAYEHCTIQDHGGNVYLHGYPNEDRDWAEYEQSQTRKKKSQEDGEEKQEPTETRCCMKCHLSSPRVAGQHNCPQCGTPFDRPVWHARNEEGELVFVEASKAKRKTKKDFEHYYRQKINAAHHSGATVRWAYTQAKRMAKNAGVRTKKPRDIQGMYVPAEGSPEWNQSVNHVFKGRKR